MSTDINEILKLFTLMTSNNSSDIQTGNSKLQELLLSKPNISMILLDIILNYNIDESHRFFAAIQLKNLIEKNWQRSVNFPDNDKEIIRRQLLHSAIQMNAISCSKFVNLIAEIIAKISRSDWNQKWPNLFNDLFANDAWMIIYRVCQVQSTRRLSQGLVLFRELASVMGRQIAVQWKRFPTIFQSKFYAQSTPIDNNRPSIGLEFDLVNTSYQLKTMCLFIVSSHLFVNENDEFSNIVIDLSAEICSFFPKFLKCYLESSIGGDNLKNRFYKFLKSMIRLLLCCQHKIGGKSIPGSVVSNRLSGDFIGLCLTALFQSNNSNNNNTNHHTNNTNIIGGNCLIKTEKLTLLLLNLLANCLRNCDQIGMKNPLFNLDLVNLFRTKFLLENDESVEDCLQKESDECGDSGGQTDDSVVNYKLEEVIDECLYWIVRSVSVRDTNGIMEMIQMYYNQINSMNLLELESFLHLMGIVVKACYYANSPDAKKCAALCNCAVLVENVISTVINSKKSKSSSPSENLVLKRCVWLLAKWVVDDPNIESVSMDRIVPSSQWCFKVAQSPVNIIVKIEVALFIEHITEKFEKMPSDFIETPIMHGVFLNPSISMIVSLLDITSSSDTHNCLIEILIKLFRNTNMWNNIELVITCSNSIYNLWNGIKWPTNETIILRNRLLECLSAIIKSCDPSVIQPILATLSIFIRDSMQLIVKPDSKRDKTTGSCDVLLDNTLQLWHDIVYNCETQIEILDNIYSLIIFSNAFEAELDKNQTALLLEIIQANYLLKVIGSINKESFSLLTFSTWDYILKQEWNPKHEEDLCVMRIQLFDLWLLGYRQLSLGPLGILMEINSYSRFLCERTKELFSSTQEEPSQDQYVCIVNSTLTVLARICLFDRSILKTLLTYLSSNDTEYKHMVIGLLNRWLLRIDNQSSCSVQQLFVLACIQWLPCCYESDPNILSGKMELLINSCIQICSNVPSVNVEQNTEMAKALPVPAERHLNLAYILWNPLSNYSSEIKKLITPFMIDLNNSVGLENFQNMFRTLDPIVQNQFIQFCTN